MKIKIVLAIITIALFSNSCFNQIKECQFDTIYYTQFDLAFLDNKGPFKDFEEMLVKDTPEWKWKDIYNNGQIVKRVYYEKWAGSEIIEDYIYTDGHLSKVISSGMFPSTRLFYYDNQDRLSKSTIYSDIFGISSEEFEYAENKIIVKKSGNEGVKIYEILINETYFKNHYPYGNYLIYDERFFIQNTPDAGTYSFEHYYDECHNLKYLIERIKENGNIMRLTVYDIKYK